MTRRSPARLLAPLALVAVAVALYTIVKDATQATSKRRQPEQVTNQPLDGGGQAAPRGRAGRAPRAGAATRSGRATPSSGIAEKTGVARWSGC